VKLNECGNFIAILVGVLVVLISSYVQLRSPQTGLLLFLSLIGAIFLYFLTSWTIVYFRVRTRKIEHNRRSIEELRKDLNNVKERLDIREEMYNLSSRVSTIEQLHKMMRNKKGQIDPRWVLIVIIIILFILFLRVKGIL